MKRKMSKDCRLRIDGDESLIPLDELREKLSVDSVIRFKSPDFDMIEIGRLTHFNISDTDHEVGRRYALVHILEDGHFDGEDEILPLLDIDEFFLARCVDVRNNVAYEDIKDFRYSLPDIKSVEELKRTILKRYKKSMSHIPDDEKLRLGVGVTELEVLEKKLNSNHIP